MLTKSSVTKLYNTSKTIKQNAKTSALLSGNIGKYEFLTVEDVLPEKRLIEKAARIKRFNIHHYVMN